MTISARVIADSTGRGGVPRITTLQLRYPKFIHGELMTHRAFSRNASSSRAILVGRLIKDVVEDPVYPSFWGKNQAGMQVSSEEHDELVGVFEPSHDVVRKAGRKHAWDRARQNAIDSAYAFASAGYHKQIVNRLLEPFCHINVVVTATEWSNFFALRCHPTAQPEMRELAEKIHSAMVNSLPQPLERGDWHLPYVNAAEWASSDEVKPCRCGAYPGGACDGWCRHDLVPVKLSVARCARVSYLTQEGKTPTVEEDLALYDRLVGAVPLHASPCEHQATPDVIEHDFESSRSGTIAWKNYKLHGNFVGWIQYRKTLSGECQ